MKQTCILLLGMHRSGTSALAGTLHQLGIYLGSDLMKPGQYNKKGYFENNLIFRFNEQLLHKVGSSWDDIFYSEYKINNTIETGELKKLSAMSLVL